MNIHIRFIVYFVFTSFNVFGASARLSDLFDHSDSASHRKKHVGPTDFPRVNDVISIFPDVSCKIVSLLGTGTDSKVFEASCGPKNEMFAIKYQYLDTSNGSKVLLRKDWEFLTLMKDVRGFPEAYYISPLGRFKSTRYSFQFMIMEKAGIPLRSYVVSPNWHVKQLIPILSQALILLNELHAKGFYFGDVHLENIMIKNNNVYLLDFGRAGPYMYSNGTLIPNSESILKASRNYIYLSPGELNNSKLSRRDDLFRLAECAVRILRGEWYRKQVTGKTADQLFLWKKYTPVDQFLIDPIIQSFYEYTRKLKFKEAPKYNFF